MKKNCSEKFKISITMKKKIYSFVVMNLFGLVTLLCLFSCDDDNYEKDCHKGGGFYCDVNGGACCEGYTYNDGHGTCYQTLEGCRRSGWSCTKCW